MLKEASERRWARVRAGVRRQRTHSDAIEQMNTEHDEMSMCANAIWIRDADTSRYRISIDDKRGENKINWRICVFVPILSAIR